MNILQRNEFDKVNKLSGEKKGEKNNEIKITKNDETDIKNYKIIFLGEVGIGAKTSMIESIINNKFQEKPWCTVGLETRIRKVLLKNGKLINLMFYDICGQESQFSLLPIKYIKNSFL